MAQNDEERRMVFDLRGRRRNVVKVAYGLLAILMAASLLLVVGPFSVGEIFNSGDVSNSEAAERYQNQAARVEQQLRAKPDDPQLLQALTRQRIYAANALAEANPQTGAAVYTTDSRRELQRAATSWEQYVKATDEPSPSVAQLVAGALFSLAETGTTPGEIQGAIESATEAQQIVADARPSLGSLSTLAYYKYFTFDFAGADSDAKRARAEAGSKFERESLENQLEEVEKQAREFKRSLAEFNKAAKAEGRGKQSLENPFGGLGTSGASP